MTRNKFNAAIARREVTLKRLRALLAAERRLNNALSNMAFLPASQQRAAHLKELRQATTVRRKLMEDA